MTYNPSWYLYCISILMGIVLVLRVSNWFFIWVGFELCLIGFLPIVKLRVSVVERLVKYFLVQARGSGLFLFSFLIGSSRGQLLCLLRMMLKLGLFPYYHWVPRVLRGLRWDVCFFTVTVQKIPALIVLCYLSYEPILWVRAWRVFCGGILGFNQTDLRKLIAYSSLRHRGWMRLCSLKRVSYLLCYLFFYFLLSLLLFFLLERHKVQRLSQKIPLRLGLLVLTLAGIPPFRIFFLKASLLAIVYPRISRLILILVGSLCSIFYYLLVMISSRVVSSERVRGKLTLSVWLVSLRLPLVLVFNKYRLFWEAV